MILLFDENIALDLVSPALGEALQDAIAASRMGNHRVLIPPRAMQRLETIEPPLAYLPLLKAAQSNWIEGQAFARNVSRIIVLTEDSDICGQIDGNKFYVHVGKLDACGVLRSASIVAENMHTDAKLIKLYIEASYGLNRTELKRYWSATPEQGGGSTLHRFVDRYVAEANPMWLVADRDREGEPSSGSTAATCVSALVRAGIYSGRAEALEGGFSLAHPNISFHVLEAIALENLVFPKVMEIFFKYCSSGEAWRREVILEQFDSFPDLDEEQSRQWLWSNFKKFGPNRATRVFDSGCIDRLIALVDSEEDVRAEFKSAFEATESNAVFKRVLDNAIRDAWAIGQRWKALS